MGYNIGRNNPNYKEGKSIIKNYCIDCKKRITSYTAKRCKTCSGLRHRKEKIKCISCGKILSSPKCKRCRKCYYEWRKINGELKGIKNPMYGRKGNLNPNYKDGSWLKKYYCKCGNSIHMVTALKGNGICASCSTKGSKNGRYIDGRSYDGYPTEFNDKLRNKIRNRDKNKCRRCNMSRKKHYKKYGKNLEVHHIDHIKKNCNENNLMTLCRICHQKITIGGK
jgi:hypothetical protein